jgi:hypothetical protein
VSRIANRERAESSEVCGKGLESLPLCQGTEVGMDSHVCKGGVETRGLIQDITIEGSRLGEELLTMSAQMFRK